MSGRGAAAPLAVTMGDPAGVGGEVALKAWLGRAASGLPPFFLIDAPGRLEALARAIGLDVPVWPIADPAEAAAAFPVALPVLPVALPRPPVPGRPDPANADAVIASIDRAVTLTVAGRAAGIVTNPIHKESLYAAGFRHPGHTEYLAELAGGVPVEMMLVSPHLRVVPMTIHEPLREAVRRVTAEAVTGCVRRTVEALRRDFAIAAPRVAVAGLNPHAGEGGTIGREEVDVIAPAVAALRAEGLDVTGPLPADSMFHAEARQAYDVAVCMYHDQALIPIKTLDFHGAVNITVGLPFVRTSPDHGTAFAIAGTGRANPASLIAAIGLGAEIAARRAALPA
ncbi:MAG: 4-hydroxythreonine-4-phosphate dehydrogenase PdxA [Alphaproteobacteria bacterium]